MTAQRGMGLLIAIVLLSVVSVGVAFTAPEMYRLVTEVRTQETISDLETLKQGIAGNPRITSHAGRDDFGFIGSMGSKPATLSDLWIKGGQPGFVYTVDDKIGAGWIGPYITKLPLQHMLSMDQDRFGAPYRYVSTPFTRATDGQQVSIRIQSAGADGVMDNADDLISDILTAELFATVTGTVRRRDNVVKSATVFLNQPANGAATQMTAVTNSSGVFTFNNVSFGTRSITVDPTLTYEEGSGKSQGSGDSTLRFRVTNYATNPVTINAITASYTPATGFYERIRIGNATVFNYNTDNGGVRPGSGVTWTFSNRTINGSNEATPVVIFPVQRQTAITPDVVIKGVGQSIVIEFQDFKNNATGGGGGNASVSGKTFTITFNDGSQNTFVVP